MKNSIKTLTILLVVFLFSNVSYGVNYTLNNTTWSNSANGNSNAPTQSGLSSSDSVIIRGNGTWTLTQAVTLAGVRISGGTFAQSTFALTGGVSVKGTATISGTGSISGAVTIASGTLTVSGAKSAGSWVMSGGNLTNSANISGPVSVTATGALAGTSSVGDVTLTSGTLTVSAAKTASSWTLNGGTLTNSANILGAITVAGTVTMSGTSSVGAVTLSSGTLTVNAAKTATSWTLNGGTLTNSAALTGGIAVAGTATISGASAIAAVSISSGTLTFGAAKSITTLTMSGGTINLGSYVISASSNISITGNATITSSGTGLINCANSQTLTINGGTLTLDNAEVVIDNLTFSSADDITTTNGGKLSFSNSGSHTITGGAADRHVIGKIRAYLDNSTTNLHAYPLGDGSVFAPVYLQGNGKDSAGTTLTGQAADYGTAYIDMVYYGTKSSNTLVDNTLPGNASGLEYWALTRSSVKPAATVTLRFSTSNTGTTYSKTRVSGTLDTVKLRTDIKIASFNFSTNRWTAATTTYSIVPASNYIAVTTSNITPNNAFTIGSTNSRTAFVTPLPVSIIDFSAKANDASIDVKWSTASEKDNAAFVVEKSLDGQTWSAIGTVKGAKTSNVVNNYGLVDYKAVAGFQYYRLKQIDLDGTVNYSKAIAVNFSKASTLNVNLFPNPAKDALNITTENNATGEVNIQILNSMGETVYNQVLEAGLVQSIDITSFIPGVYYVTVIAEGESKIIRLLKN